MRDTPRDDEPLEPPPPPAPGPPPGPAPAPAPAAAPTPAAAPDPGPTRIHERGLLIATRIGKQLQRAIWIGMAVAFVAAFAIGFVMPSSLFAVAVGLGIVVATLVGLAVAFLSVDTPVRHAYEAFGWLGRRELDRVRVRTGRGAPTRTEEIERWLREVPPSPAVAPIRAELLAMQGRTAEARAEIASLPPGDDLATLERASVETLITFIETGRLDQAAIGALAARLDPASDLALEAAVVMAVGEARALAGRDDPAWTRPLEDVRPRLGRAATEVILRDTWSRVGLQYAAVGGLAAILAATLRPL